MTDPQPTRRSFLGRLVLIAGSIPFLAALAGVLRTMLAPASRHGGGVVAVCPVKDLPPGEVVARAVAVRMRRGAFQELAEFSVYLRAEARDGRTRVVALSGDCTHLGCPVHWSREQQLFLCPCHGGAFAADGSVKAGPPPAPLQSFEVLPEQADGMVRIRIPV
jgi:Rieske Fe-S protein